MDYFRSAAPWVTVGVGALLIAPDFYMVIASNFAPMDYAYGIHGARTLPKTVASAFGYLASSFGYVAVALTAAFLATRPGGAALKDSAWPSDDRRRLAFLAFWAALLVPVLFAIAARLELTGLWSMASWSLLPVILLSSFNRSQYTSSRLPLMADFRGSGSIESDADCVAAVHRPSLLDQNHPDPQAAIWCVLKQRGGSLGKVQALLDPKSLTFVKNEV